VKSALISNDSTKARQINVETKGRRRAAEWLRGFDSGQGRRGNTAKNVEGVKDVQNRLLIRDANRSGGQAVDDTVIAAKVKGEIAGKAGLGTASDVNVRGE